MPQLNITTSTNITVLDSQIVADLCAGNFIVDIRPSVWIGTGYNNVLGAKIKIVNSYGVSIKDYGNSYDIEAPMNSQVTVAIPLLGNNFDYQIYTVYAQLTDANGAVYVVEKTIKVCEPNRKDKTKKYGSISASITGSCKNGKVTIIISEPPTYQEIASSSKTQSYVITYPTGSIAPLTTTANALSVQLYEGVYKVVGDVCANYSLGDNKSAKVPYKVNCKKPIYCTVDLCCVYDKLAQLQGSLNDCHDNDKVLITEQILSALMLLKTIELGAECGEDVSSYIIELEELLQCKCTCSANEGTPVINGEPTGDFNITGCNVSSSVSGLTKTFVINDYEYVVYIDPSLGFMSAGTPTLSGCTKTLPITFNIGILYQQLKNQIVNNTEYNYWGSVIKNTINDLPQNILDCFNIDSSTWNAYTFRQAVLFVFNKICSCCGTGSVCDAVIADVTVTNVGNDTRIDWANNQNVFGVDIYIDGAFVTTILAPTDTYLVAGTNDGNNHTFQLVSKCSDGSAGNSQSGIYNNAPSNVCPTATNLDFGSGVGCTAPLNVQVVDVVGGNSIRFDGAITPPPSNSYVVSRSLHGVNSYTVIGAAVYDAGLNKYEITDATASPNVLYDYKVESQCADGSRPNVVVQYAEITCPTMSFNPTTGSIYYSFTNVGAAITKYLVTLYDATGLTIIEEDVLLAPFSTPVTGSFTGLVDDTDYVVRVKVFIGNYGIECTPNNVSTDSLTFPYECPSTIVGGSGISPNSSVLTRVNANTVQVVMNLDIPAATYPNVTLMQGNPLDVTCVPSCDLTDTDSLVPGATFTFYSTGHLKINGTVTTPFTGNLTLTFDETLCSS